MAGWSHRHHLFPVPHRPQEEEIQRPFAQREEEDVQRPFAQREDEDVQRPFAQQLLAAPGGADGAMHPWEGSRP